MIENQRISIRSYNKIDDVYQSSDKLLILGFI